MLRAKCKLWFLWLYNVKCTTWDKYVLPVYTITAIDIIDIQLLIIITVTS